MGARRPGAHAGPCRSSEEVVRHVRHKYAALVSMCDKYLGKVLDFMDNHDMWKDTALIVTTDHGYLLGEHQWWAKSIMPLYNEIAHIPMFAWDPRCGKKGERRQTLVQNIDLAPTVLELNGIPVPPDMLGKPVAALHAPQSTGAIGAALSAIKEYEKNIQG